MHYKWIGGNSPKSTLAPFIQTTIDHKKWAFVQEKNSKSKKKLMKRNKYKIRFMKPESILQKE